MPFSSGDRRTKVLRARKNGKHTSSETVRRRDAARVSNAFTDACILYGLSMLPTFLKVSWVRSGAFIDSLSPPCEGGWRDVSLVGRVFRRLLLSACGGVLNPSVCCADSSPRRGAKLPATSPYRIHDRAEKIESSDTAPIHAAPACLQKSLFRQAEPPHISSCDGSFFVGSKVSLQPFYPISSSSSFRNSPPCTVRCWNPCCRDVVVKYQSVMGTRDGLLW